MEGWLASERNVRICAILGAAITLPGIWSLRQDKRTAQAAASVEAEAAEMPPPDIPLSEGEVLDGAEPSSTESRGAP